MRGWERAACAAVMAFVVWGIADRAMAWPSYRNNVPHGYTFGSGSYGTGCLLCHDNANGGYGCASGTAPCNTSFGLDFRSVAHTAYSWDTWMRDRDSDGDGRTNGQELVYFGTSWTVGNAVGASPTQPWTSVSRHADECSLQSTYSSNVH